MTQERKSRRTPQSSKPRRLPAPKIPAELRPLPPRQLGPPPVDNPYVTKIAHLIEQMATVSGLSPYVLLRDWLAMLESGLKMWPANMRAMALEGQFIEDPPEIQAIFSQARERYLRVSAQRPAVYRQMQEAFSEAFALLLESATPGLEQINDNPDVIGQVFIACLQPSHNSPWWRYFPDWSTALVVAQDALPEAHQLVYFVLAEAALQARAEGHALQLDPGVNFPEWFEAIWPFVEPLRLGSPLVSSSVELLAAATQFPGWALKTGLVKFSWDPTLDPLIQHLININAMLFGLNGYIVAHCETLLDIQEQLAQMDGQPASTSAVYQLPPTLDETPEPNPNRQQKRQPVPGQSFADLFRHKSKS